MKMAAETPFVSSSVRRMLEGMRKKAGERGFDTGAFNPSIELVMLLERRNEIWGEFHPRMGIGQMPVGEAARKMKAEARVLDGRIEEAVGRVAEHGISTNRLLKKAFSWKL